MKHFNSHNTHGFSFIEIILTVALIGAVVTPVFVLQFNVLTLLTRSSGKMRSIFYIDSLFSQATVREDDQDPKNISFEKRYEEPTLVVNYTVASPSEQSRLHTFKHLYRTQSRGTWSEAGGKQQLSEVSFVFSPPQESSDHAQKTTPQKKQAQTPAQGGS